MATMEVILTEDVHRLGNAGDVVKVKAGFGRNYLLPQGKALLATASRVKEIEHQRRVIDELQKKAIAGLRDVERRVKAVELVFEMQASPEGKLFGSVTNADIAARFAAAGVDVERRKIVIAEPIKSTGEHAITVRLHREVQTPMTVKVVSTGEPAPVAEPEGLQTEEPRDEDDEAE
ncbi:MAG TPA: 50S ribosomal protein L9 [Myxococcota bacterium]|jgi:large subunit ribosomal protein L9|nr:50S ribosomal protein L9 [Myxococcota bacterium]